MRKSFHSLSGLVRGGMGRDPLDGDVYVFINRHRDRIKLLHWEPGGLVLYSKILERGTFGKPGPLLPDGSMAWRDLMMLVEGIVNGGLSRLKRMEKLRCKAGKITFASRRHARPRSTTLPTLRSSAHKTAAASSSPSATPSATARNSSATTKSTKSAPTAPTRFLPFGRSYFVVDTLYIGCEKFPQTFAPAVAISGVL